MEIIFENIVPEFLEKEKVSTSEVWNNNIHLHEKFLHIIAPSGRGKTSLIHFIYGLRKDYSGNILYNGKPVKNINPEETSVLRSTEVSIVFQDLRLFPEHTAYENISVKRELSPFGGNRIKEMASLLGIENKLHQKARHCSYGEQQRIAIIRALQQPFKLLVMDEPFSHLDEKNSVKAMQLILEEAGKRNASILLLDLDKVPFFPAEKTYHL